jgi:uncharacterized protein (TIGR00730 family)
MKICVFCSSSDDLDPDFVDTARRLGRWIGAQGHGLVWGGCNVGLMNLLGASVQDGGGTTHAIVPRFMQEKGLVFAAADEVEIVDSMHARKERMRQAADAFVALPGGVGTWEEFFEVLALKKLRRLHAPLILMNTRRYYEPLLTQMRLSRTERFSPVDLLEFFAVAADVDAAIRILQKVPDVAEVGETLPESPA